MVNSLATNSLESPLGVRQTGLFVVRLTFLVVAVIAHLVPSLAHAQVEIRTRPRNQRDHYAWVTQLESGDHLPVPNASQDSSRSRRFRLAVLTSEIFSTILIEEVRYGVEACCARVASVREVDLSAMARHFGIRGELAGVRIIRSLSPTAFRINFRSRTFDLTNIDRPTITVTEVRLVDKLSQ